MRFSIWPTSTNSFDHILTVVTHCDRTGWDGTWIMDHFMLDRPDDEAEDTPMLESFALMGALAARTDNLRIGPLVLGNTYRHPAVVAKAAVTLDQVTGGRFVLGLGAGWQVNEHLAYGIPMFSTRTRMDRYDDACAVIRSLITSDRTTLVGEHYQVSDAPCRPTPPDGRLKVLIGAKGERRGLLIAARYADEWNSWATVEQFTHRSGVLWQHCEAIGRDHDEIERSTQALVLFVDDAAKAARMRGRPSDRPQLIGSSAEIVDQIGPYAEAGLAELIVPDWFNPTPEQSIEFADRFHTEVAVHFR